jgi:hypothetical protein
LLHRWESFLGRLVAIFEDLLVSFFPIGLMFQENLEVLLDGPRIDP